MATKYPEIVPKKGFSIINLEKVVISYISKVSLENYNRFVHLHMYSIVSKHD
jgi:hypothetical protein